MIAHMSRSDAFSYSLVRFLDIKFKGQDMTLMFIKGVPASVDRRRHDPNCDDSHIAWIFPCIVLVLKLKTVP